MDNEIAEGLELGTSLMITVATLVIMSILCGISRQAYINRANTIAYQNDLLACSSWSELYKQESNKNVQGTYVDSTFVTVDNMCQWIMKYYNDYHIIVVDSYNMLSTGYIDTSRLNINKWAASWFPATNMDKNYARNVQQSLTVTSIVDHIFDINIRRSAYGWPEASVAQVYVYSTDDYFYHSLDNTSYFADEYKGKQTFEENYALPKGATIVFAINQ